MNPSTLYRMELSPQQQQQQASQAQVGGPLPLQGPPPATPANPAAGAPDFLNMQQGMQQETPAPKEDFREKFIGAKDNMMKNIGDNRFTSMMQQRVGEFAQRLQAQVAEGQLTIEEAKRVLNEAILEETHQVSAWMDGIEPPTNWKQMRNSAFIGRYLERNKQHFDKLKKMKAEIIKEKTLLDKVYDKEDVRFQKALDALAQKTNKASELEKSLREGMYGGEVNEGGTEMLKARGEEVIGG